MIALLLVRATGSHQGAQRNLLLYLFLMKLISYKAISLNLYPVLSTMKYIFMKYSIFCVLISTSILLFECNNNSIDDPIEKEWVLSFSDEFDGTTIDVTKWDKPEYNRRINVNGPDGWWLREDSYLDGNGNLVIRARKIDNLNNDNDPYDYSTGAIRTEGKFQQKFGKFEIRCQLPTQAGWWVAFWLMSPSVSNVDDSGEDGTEIDIFEGFGWTDKLNFALHWDGYGEEHKYDGKQLTLNGIRQDFHTFTLEWSEQEYVFFVDDTEVWRTSAGGVSKVPAYVKVTGELSTEEWAINELWSNDPEQGIYPDYFLVDYVRVYQKQ